jgi:hypothetical protein
MLFLTLILFFLLYLLPGLVICNLVELFNSLAGLEGIQVNKASGSIHWLVDPLLFNLLGGDPLIPGFISGSL